MYAGSRKLTGLGNTMAMFGKLELPGWFGGFIGVAEVLGGIGLLVPRTVRTAALGLSIIMLGAVFMHTAKTPGGLANGMPAVVLLVLRSRTAANTAAQEPPQTSERQAAGR